MNIHEFYIKRCIEIAKNGLGHTYPNPSVGCVIVHKETIIGEGYTSPPGQAHAEVNAIHSVSDPSLLTESTLYVTLEPCSHYGRTPPCADLIITHKIPRVVIGTLDSNKEVLGKGVRKLEEAGIEVITGILEQECRELNRRFLCFHEKQRPYIILKWAESNDGFIAPPSDPDKKPEPVWLSNSGSRQLVHKWRSEEMGILIGTRTAILDNPRLDTRTWYGNSPVRFVIDLNLKIPTRYHVLDKSVRTIIITLAENCPESTDMLQYEKVFIANGLPNEICRIAVKYGIQSLIVEGGAQTINSFISEDLWDEARVFTAPIKLFGGVQAPKIEITPISGMFIENDKVSLYRNKPVN
ncbi:bifunctional diaminohydroxyphosphoribosylaminopyrimidine deaminase/5-amino-6-(5-phosphoribosylamino)uracil reductase RibD [Robertkochia solimangrovi]|uniref:bifunctional diaminohydroxyphosphoribosylaminopyrimidine deaminase/5-amino-6-(5-phosphoribosylamino)uracil reductase RibD n=1 Tax=Robertkochia solimangrovi TaxID=2213046 RepID=UPI00117ECC62|nr:bifunctional diaminohydroxyphosphoribosylaminopyrimidine deaminase/5-amino-6-(5-phosphoribosylamino)uracil reductase RibD [Robertkochia solimangrovi]TRZ41064.1 bifunctional diaminohydroxyphosphoribosylaminopyrimidine deaminase/5-amino-6-(5-phosphoribosylamino)uracil reductase RibD [Robertkochia solimangrovi]